MEALRPTLQQIACLLVAATHCLVGFAKYLLSTYYLLHTVLDAGGTAVNKNNHGVYSLKRRNRKHNK